MNEGELFDKIQVRSQIDGGIVGKPTIDDATAPQQRLEQEFGIFSVVRKGLASGSCVRITPQVFNTPDEIGRLVDALRKLAA